MTQMNKEYGTALFMLAKEQGAENEYAIDLECVSEVFGGNMQYLDLLSSPTISMDERLSAIDAAFDGAVSPDVVSFIKLLCQKGRIHSFWGAAEEYKNLLNAQNKVSTAHITSAVELTDEEKSKLKDKLEIKTGHSVMLEFSIDENILGGIIIEIDGKIIDATIKHRLNEVKDVISQ